MHFFDLAPTFLIRSDSFDDSASLE